MVIGDIVFIIIEMQFSELLFSTFIKFAFNDVDVVRI